MRRLPFLFLAFLFFLPVISPAKELPKIAVWDLTPGDIKATYAQDLTSILVSEVTKLGKYEVFSQENVRTLAGWTAERMNLGCTDSRCLTALGQMDIAKLISGRIGKIGNRYSVSLNLFDTQKAKAENAVSEFGRSEDELIDLVQVAVRKLLGETGPTQQPSSPTPLAGSPPSDVINETSWSVDNHPVHWLFHKNGTIEAPRLWKGIWKVIDEGYEVRIPSYGDRFIVKFAPNGKTFTAYKNGAVYRRGVRVGPP